MLEQTLNTHLHSQVNTLHKNKNENIPECKTSPSTLGLFSAKFKATANELCQEKSQKGSTMTFCSLVTAIKFCYHKSIIKRVVKNNVKLKIKCKIMLKWK